jgi:hypothetical protein
VGIPDIGSTDGDAGRFKGITAVGRAVPKRCPDPDSNFPAEQGERTMPMLFWLPTIFVSAFWEINGLPPRALANNYQAPV